VHDPVASVGWIVSAVACTTPPEFLAPMARTQLSTVRSAAVAAEDSVTDRVVGTVTELAVPVAPFTVTVVPVTAVTSPVTNAALGLSVGAPDRDGRGLPEGKAPGDPPGAPGPPPGRNPAAQLPFTALLRRTELAVTAPVESFCPAMTTQLPATMSPADPVLVAVMVVVPL